MKTYNSFNELNGKTLQSGDRVNFKHMKYIVDDDFLKCVTKMNNAEIFEFLKINKHAITREVYGYTDRGGIWPSSKSRDYEALTRLCLVLFAFLEGSKSVTVDMPNGGVVTIDHKKHIPLGYLGRYKTYIFDDILKVGCTEIPFKKVESIYKKMCQSKNS